MAAYEINGAGLFPGQSPQSVVRTADGATIPFYKVRNSDCVRFLMDWKAGVVVTNADGSNAPYSVAAVEALGLTPPP